MSDFNIKCDKTLTALIDNVVKRPFLYDSSAPGYWDQQLRKPAWAIIGNEIGLSADCAKKTWDKLCRRFTETLSLRLYGTTTWSPKMLPPPWKYEEAMCFLLPFVGKKLHQGLSAQDTVGKTEVDERLQASDCVVVVESDEESDALGCVERNVNPGSSKRKILLPNPKVPRKKANRQLEPQTAENTNTEPSSSGRTRRESPSYEQIREASLKNIPKRPESFESSSSDNVCSRNCHTLTLQSNLEDVFFSSMLKMTKQCSNLDQAKIKSRLCQSVMQAVIAKEIMSRKDKTPRIFSDEKVKLESDGAGEIDAKGKCYVPTNPNGYHEMDIFKEADCSNADTQNKNKNLDDVDKFFLSMAEMIKKIPDALKRKKIESRISKIVLQAALETEEEALQKTPVNSFEDARICAVCPNDSFFNGEIPQEYTGKCLFS